MEHKDYRLAAVMFTDIVGFSRMMEEDEAGTLTTLDFHNKLVREQVEKHRGKVIKTIGDAFLAQFNTTLDAVNCSLAVQAGIEEYNTAKLGKSLTLRIGIHMGDIYFYENDALGEGINIASRLQSMTKPGRITISREVYSQVSGKIPMRVESIGQVHLKNITREVHAYEIIPGGEDNNSKLYQHSKAPAAEDAPAPVEVAPIPRRTSSSSPSISAERPVPPSFRELKDEWKEIKNQIKSQIKNQIKQEIQDKLDESIPGHASRREWKRQMKDRARQGWDVAMSELRTGESLPSGTNFQTYKEKFLKRIEGHRQGLAGHLSSFIGVNAFLAFLNITTSPGFPWCLFPLGGWGIGLISHWANYRSDKKSVRELEQIEDLNEEDFKLLKKFQDARSGFNAHIFSNLAVAGFVSMIWFITGMGFPWHLIVAGALGLGMISHLGGYAAVKSTFKKAWNQWKKTGRSDKSTSKPVSQPTADPLVSKANALRDSILTQAQGMKGGNPFGDDMTLTLDNYVKQISELSQIEQEIGQIVTSFNVRELEHELVGLNQKISNTQSQTLKQEYEKSVGEIERQKKSFDDLAEQQEILNLRINSAMKNLQQMQIDLARIKGLSDGQKEGYFLSLKDRSEELSRYIEDYREGLKETV